MGYLPHRDSTPLGSTGQRSNAHFAAGQNGVSVDREFLEQASIGAPILRQNFDKVYLTGALLALVGKNCP